LPADYDVNVHSHGFDDEQQQRDGHELADGEPQRDVV
jgi:hypothetical protein